MALKDERKRKRERKKYFKQCYLWWNRLKKLLENPFFFVWGIQLWLNLLLNFLKDSSHSGLAYRLSSLLIDKSSRPVFRGKECFKVRGKVILITFLTSALDPSLLSYIHTRRLKVLFEDSYKGVSIWDTFSPNTISNEKLHRRTVKNSSSLKLREEDGNESAISSECYSASALLRFALR